MRARKPTSLALSVGLILSVVAGGAEPPAFSTDDQARVFGVREVELRGGRVAGNPFDVPVTVRFTPPSRGAARAVTVSAFHDGEDVWRARTYVSEAGEWTWTSECATDAALHGRRGKFVAVPSELPGRLLPHPKNPRHWITENGRWFLNLSDTAYFLLCAHDGNGEPVTDAAARRYIADAAARGITSVRCFLSSSSAGFSESPDQWRSWFFADATLDRFRLEKLQVADRRLRMLLDAHPGIAVQLILFPLEGYARDGRFWVALTPVQRERLLRNLVARFAAYPQLFWLFVNNTPLRGEKPEQQRARPRGRGLPSRGTIRGSIRAPPGTRGGCRLSSEPRTRATYIHIEHAHDLGAAQYAPYHAFAKPVFLGEDRYEQDHAERDPLHMRYWQRRLFWSWLLSGGSTNYGGRWWVVQPYGETRGKPTTVSRPQGRRLRPTSHGTRFRARHPRLFRHACARPRRFFGGAGLGARC